MIGMDHSPGKVTLRPETTMENDLLIVLMTQVPGANYIPPRWLIDEDKIVMFNNLLLEAKRPDIKFVFSNAYLKWKDEYKAKMPLMIKCGVIESKIIGNFDLIMRVQDPLSVACRYFFKPAVRDKRFKSGHWNGYIELYDKRRQTFPTGLLYIITEKLDSLGVKYVISTEYEQSPKRMFNWAWNPRTGIIKDKDQIDAVQIAIAGKRGVLKAPTGFGKTAILAVDLVSGYGVPSLFLANRKSLLMDAKKAFVDMIDGVNDVDVDQIKDGFFGKFKMGPEVVADDVPYLNSKIIIGTIQSVNSRLEDTRTEKQMKHWLNNVCKLVLVDECQFVGTKMWDNVLNECHAPLRFALSATPKRTDGASLKINAQSGPPLFSTTAGEQIEKQRLCELRIKYIPFNHGLYNEDDQSIQYAEAYTSWIVNNQLRNELIVDNVIRLMNEGRFTLLLVNRIEHGFVLKNMLLGEGVPEPDVRYVYGETRDQVREAAIKEFRKGEFKILIGSTIFDAGVNIPVISGVVIAGAGNSEITLVQKIGRGARNVDYEETIGYLPEFMLKSPDKKITEVIDIMDENVKFFYRQAWNRYETAQAEFEKKRVKVDGDATHARRRYKGGAQIRKQIDQFSSQLEMLNSLRSEDAVKIEIGARNDAQQGIFDAFSKD